MPFFIGAVVFVLFAIVLVITLIQFSFEKRSVHY